MTGIIGQLGRIVLVTGYYRTRKPTHCTCSARIATIAFQLLLTTEITGNLGLSTGPLLSIERIFTRALHDLSLDDFTGYANWQCGCWELIGDKLKGCG